MTAALPSAVLALDIGGTKVEAGLVDAAGQVHGAVRVPSRADDGPEAVLAALETAGRRALAAAPELRVSSVGVATAGVVDDETGAIAHATGTMPGWAGTSVRTRVEELFAMPAAVLNDVQAHGLGEARLGGGRGARSVVVLAVGTGIGGALVLDGRVLIGAHGVAGHLGHLPVPEAAGLTCTCGREGHLEGLASGWGTLRAFRARGGTAESTAQVAAIAAGGGAQAELAAQVLASSGQATGRAVGAVLNLLDPDLVLLTGGMAQSVAGWRAAVDEGIRLEAMDAVADTPVRVSDTRYAALLGAAIATQERSTWAC